MKRVLSIQDLSCLGKCSLTVAQPVVSAMGCSCTPLPTALLSSHTAFSNPYRRLLTEDMKEICQCWQYVGAKFDVISVGYLADPIQATAVEQVLDAFPGYTIVDPVMGDHGRLYGGITQAHVAAMKKLCRRTNVLLPNVTEAALLTDISYAAQADEAYYRTLIAKLRQFGAEAAIITGVTLQPGKTGFIGYDGEKEFSYQADWIPRQSHGTGDLFAAVVTGAVAKGSALEKAAGLAARFVERVLLETKEVSPFGVEFESCLPWLWENM